MILYGPDYKMNVCSIKSSTGNKPLPIHCIQYQKYSISLPHTQTHTLSLSISDTLHTKPEIQYLSYTHTNTPVHKHTKLSLSIADTLHTKPEIQYLSHTHKHTRTQTHTFSLSISDRLHTKPEIQYLSLTQTDAHKHTHTLSHSLRYIA